jgi:3-deoxy-7-phosphoheptulonate synthase
MIIELEKNIAADKFQAIEYLLTNHKLQSNKVNTNNNLFIVAIGNASVDIRTIGNLPGVKDVHKVTDAYKLVSKKWKVGYSSIDLGDGVLIGDGNLSLMAGPCSIESEEQVHSIVNHLAVNNIKIMRGGVFKPRTSPYAFRGLGIDGLKYFSAICKQQGIKIITEVMEVSQIDEMYDYIDIYQVGTRNSQNFNLLDALGKIDKPVLLKRAMNGTIDELLQSAEYMFAKGNDKIILCERGIRTYETAYRNTFDINAIPMLKEKTHLPVIADPSHGVGIRKLVPAVALAAAAAGADGVIYEVHEQPEVATSDGAQTLNYEESGNLIKKLNLIRK